MLIFNLSLSVSFIACENKYKGLFRDEVGGLREEVWTVIT